MIRLAYPEKVAELHTLMDNWRKDVGAQIPSGQQIPHIPREHTQTEE
jgi:hypothetical protein